MLKIRASPSFFEELVVKYLTAHHDIQTAVGGREYKKDFPEKEISSEFCRIRIWKRRERTQNEGTPKKEHPSKEGTQCAKHQRNGKKFTGGPRITSFHFSIVSL